MPGQGLHMLGVANSHIRNHVSLLLKYVFVCVCMPVQGLHLLGVASSLHRLDTSSTLTHTVLTRMAKVQCLCVCALIVICLAQARVLMCCYFCAARCYACVLLFCVKARVGNVFGLLLGVYVRLSVILWL